MELNSKQREFLRKKAHDLSPVIMIGKFGVNEGVVHATEEALDDHELIKVKFIDFKDEKRELSHSLAEKSKAALVRIIGNTAILYRPSSDPSRQNIKLP